MTNNTPQEAIFAQKRQEMITKQLKSRQIKNPQVLAAMEKVPRHSFAPQEVWDRIYDDCAVAIGYDQTISQPYIVAYMTEVLNLQGTERVLEIGTGTGYQTAVLAEIVQEVYSTEIIPELANTKQKLFQEMGYQNIFVDCRDGYLGWEKYAPYDAIIVTCAPKKLSPHFKQQMSIGGRMVVPVDHGSWWGQSLTLFTKINSEEFQEQKLFGVRFVPMTGEAEK